MSRTYRNPDRAGFFRRIRNEDDFVREEWRLSRQGVNTYRQFVAHAHRDSKRNWLSVPSWYGRMKNRHHRSACQDAMRHFDHEASFVPDRKKGWCMDL
jgi:hypothetical protein